MLRGKAGRGSCLDSMCHLCSCFVVQSPVLPLHFLGSCQAGKKQRWQPIDWDVCTVCMCVCIACALWHGRFIPGAVVHRVRDLLTTLMIPPELLRLSCSRARASRPGCYWNMLVTCPTTATTTATTTAIILLPCCCIVC